MIKFVPWKTAWVEFGGPQEEAETSFGDSYSRAGDDEVGQVMEQRYWSVGDEGLTGLE